MVGMKGRFSVRGNWGFGPSHQGDSLVLGANDGVYFVESPASGHTIEFFSFASRRREVVLSRPEGARFLGAMDVSPDRRWLLYSQLDRVERNIMLVENFR